MERRGLARHDRGRHRYLPKRMREGGSRCKKATCSRALRGLFYVYCWSRKSGLMNNAKCKVAGPRLFGLGLKPTARETRPLANLRWVHFEDRRLDLIGLAITISRLNVRCRRYSLHTRTRYPTNGWQGRSAERFWGQNARLITWIYMDGELY